MTVHPTETEYWRVQMGPIPDRPRWHQALYAKQSYSFPSVEAATRFAKAHKEKDPGRDIVIEYPDGRRWNGKEWV
ncbi:hypothetical protein PBI_JF4_67 [Mycobacterium phage JF4]|uniref:Uncharacterized protein n=1 Tax=Mycobacterium phage MK4 TaxID=2725639 RepID=A0A6M3TAN6_9CAUD|nr:hypothetical protein PBI_MK4_69 [Mycobacterium phage MK4]QJD52198.1 hypothetical protein PBI_JF4_67 [Mycobacterium phage JF4]QJD52278.1 hypothetical protein PBI_JF2_67 [Mycobacterium phage JF2]BBC53782.1 hypothetical protein [Mycobacterium phage B1]